MSVIPFLYSSEMKHRRFVLIGNENSGIASLSALLREVGNGGMKVECLEGVGIIKATERFVTILQNRLYQTTFLIVIPVTRKTPSVEWLNSVKFLNNQLALSSFNLFSSAMLVLTHADELCPSLNSNNLTQIVREKCKNEVTWEFLLRSVGYRFICVDSTQQAIEFKIGILNQIQQISKPSFNILVHGNNGVESKELMNILHLSNHDNVIELENARLKFYCYPDLDLFQGYQQAECGTEISRLIGNHVEHGEGISLILILISQCEIFSRNMKEMITNIPTNHVFRMDSRTEQYWWDYTTVLFSFKDNSNGSRDEILRSIKGNIGIEEVVKRSGNRYIWMSDTSPENMLIERISSECNKSQARTGNREFIGGPTQSYHLKVEKNKPINDTSRSIIKNILIVVMLMLLVVLFVIFFPVTLPVGIILFCVFCVLFVLKRRS